MRSGVRTAVRSETASAIHHPLTPRAQIAVIDHLGQMPPAAAAFVIVRPINCNFDIGHPRIKVGLYVSREKGGAGVP